MGSPEATSHTTRLLSSGPPSEANKLPSYEKDKSWMRPLCRTN